MMSSDADIRSMLAPLRAFPDTPYLRAVAQASTPLRSRRHVNRRRILAAAAVLVAVPTAAAAANSVGLLHLGSGAQTDGTTYDVARYALPGHPGVLCDEITVTGPDAPKAVLVGGGLCGPTSEAMQQDRAAKPALNMLTLAAPRSIEKPAGYIVVSGWVTAEVARVSLPGHPSIKLRTVSGYTRRNFVTTAAPGSEITLFSTNDEVLATEMVQDSA